MWRVESSFSTSRTRRTRRGRNRSQRITCSPLGSPRFLDSPRFPDSPSSPLVLRSIGALAAGSFFDAPVASCAAILRSTLAQRERESSSSSSSSGVWIVLLVTKVARAGICVERWEWRNILETILPRQQGRRIKRLAGKVRQRLAVGGGLVGLFPTHS